MAATLNNAAAGTPKLTRGKPYLLGTLTALNNGVSFTLSMCQEFSVKKLVIQVPSGTVTTAVLEVSIDGGATWVILPVSQALTITGQLTGDAAASFGAVYEVSGFGSGALFHFGVTSGTITSSTVWALVD